MVCVEYAVQIRESRDGEEKAVDLRRGSRAASRGRVGGAVGVRGEVARSDDRSDGEGEDVRL